jgi:hypothetical protein
MARAAWGTGAARALEEEVGETSSFFNQRQRSNIWRRLN